MFLLGLLVPAGLARANFLSDWLAKPAEAVALPTAGNVQTLGLQPMVAFNLASPLAIGGGETTVVGGAALLPDSGPLGTMADVAEWPTNGQIVNYTVRPGDTLSEIAGMFDVSVNTIAWANDISAKAPLRTGQSLVILPISGLRHTVLKGETLASLAKTYHGDVEEIVQYNGLESRDLAIGQVVIIPNGELAAPIAKPGTKPSGNPYRGGSGPSIAGYYAAPVKGYIKTQGLHGYNGVDLASTYGANIYAAAEGRVIVSKADGWNGGYGQYIVIAHPNGTQTLYAHLSQNLVGVGASVEQGQAIGKMGSTGKSTGNHLHFEVRGARNPF